MSTSKSHLTPESATVVTIDDQGIRCLPPSGKEHSVLWTQMMAVIIETNDSGPAGTDVFWLLLGENKTACIIPQEATGEDLLFEAFRRLVGFDYNAAIAAMSCVENRQFLCWKK